MSTLFLHLAALASGVAALAHQLVWVRRLSEVLGSSISAVTVVLSIFFLGLGLGARLLGPAIDARARSGHDRRAAFVGLELVIAAAGLAFLPLSLALESLYNAAAPAEWTIGAATALKSLIAAGLLALPTLAMGATLPALVRLGARAGATTGPVASLYGLNTVGGAIGVALTLLVLLPQFGVRGTAAAAAALNVIAALAVLVAGARRRAEDAPDHGGRHPSALILTAAFASGFLGLALEVAWTRALAPRFLSTIYSFGMILLAYLAAMGIGSVAARFLPIVRTGRSGYAVIAIATGVAVVASVAALGAISSSLEYGALPTLADRLRHEAGAALRVMGPALLLLGLNFPLLVGLAGRGEGGLGERLGRIYLANTAGSVLAPPLVSFALLPMLGLRTLLLGLGVAYVVFAVAALPRWAGWSRTRHGAIGALAAVATIVAMAAAPADLRLWRHTDQDTLIAYVDGPSASLSVAMEPDSTRFLKVDNSYRLGDTRTRFAQQRQGLLPVLWHPNPQNALFLGIGTGASAGAAARFGGVSVDALDLLPELVDLLPHFSDINYDLAARAADSDSVRLLAVDARHFVKASDVAYDVIVGDLFVPWRAGEGQMYTREHLAAVRDRLAPDGLFCQWLPGYQLRVEETRTITATFLDVFEHVSLFWLYFNAAEPAFGLVGSVAPLDLDVTSMAGRMRVPHRRDVLRAAGLNDVRPVVGSFVAPRDRLAEWIGSAPVETRDRPVIEFLAPTGTFGNLPDRSRAHVVELLGLTTPIDRGLDAFASLDGGAHTSLLRYQRGVAQYLRGRHAALYRQDAVAAMTAYAAALADIPDMRVLGVLLEHAVAEAIGARNFPVADIGIDALVRLPSTAYVGHYLSARRSLAANDPDAAVAALQRAIQVHPEHDASWELLRQLTGADR